MKRKAVPKRDFKVGKARLRDKTSLIKMTMRAERELHGEMPSAEEALDVVDAMMKKEHVFVARDAGGGVIGMRSVTRKPMMVGYMEGAAHKRTKGMLVGNGFVMRGHRRKGISSALVEHIERTVGKKSNLLTVTETDASEKGYKKAGWEELGKAIAAFEKERGEVMHTKDNPLFRRRPKHKR